MLCIGAPPGPQQDFLSAPSFTAPLNQDLDCGHRYFLHKQRHVWHWGENFWRGDGIIHIGIISSRSKCVDAVNVHESL